MLTVKDRVKELCDSNGITIHFLEKTLGFGHHTIRNWDVAKPNSEKLAKVAEFFNVSTDYLLYGEDPAQSALNPTLQFALVNGDKTYTINQLKEIQKFADYVYERDKK